MPGNWLFLDVGADVAVLGADISDKAGIITISSPDAATAVAAALVGQSSFVLGQQAWYIAGRFGAKTRGNTTGANDVHLTFGAVIGNSAAYPPVPDIVNFLTQSRIECGYIKSVSTAKWSAQFYDGVSAQSLVSTVNLDTNLHNFEMWYDGANVFLSVDGETPISAAPTHLPTAALILGVFHVREASEATPADLGIDKFLCMTGLPATYTLPPAPP